MARGVPTCLWRFDMPLRQHWPLQRGVSSALPTADCMLLRNLVYLPRVLSDNIFIIDKGLPVPASTLIREVQSREKQLYWKRKIGSWEERTN